MIGNDIVDLKTSSVQSGWRQKRFLNKVFTDEEQSLILNSGDRFKMVWLLWSIKESAYKIYVQQHSKRFFAPKIIQCQLFNKTEGLAIIKGEKYATKSEIKNGYIHSIAFAGCIKKAWSSCFKIQGNSYSIQHEESYQQIKLAFSKKFNLPLQEIQIKKNAIGIPKLFQNNRQLPLSFSISHHGNYGAFSILREQGFTWQT